MNNVGVDGALEEAPKNVDNSALEEAQIVGEDSALEEAPKNVNCSAPNEANIVNKSALEEAPYPQNALEEAFITLLKEANLKQKRQWLKSLLNNIHSEENLKRENKADIEAYVEFKPEFLKQNDPLLAELKQDLATLDMVNSNSNKPKTLWLGDESYEYGNTRHPPNPLDNKTPAICKLRDMVNNDGHSGTVVDALIAYYPTGYVCQSKHADDEPEIDQEIPIRTFSIGCTRSIEFYDAHGKIAKTLELNEGSLYIMKSGCQQLFKHKLPQNINISGPRWCISFRGRSRFLNPVPAMSLPTATVNDISEQTISNIPTTDITVPLNNTLNSSRDLFEDSLASTQSVRIAKKRTTLILGTSQQVELVEKKLAKKSNVCFNLSKGGNKIAQISKTVDTFYTDHSHDCNVVNIILAVGINDIRYCRRGINHLKTPLVQLIEKLKNFFPSARIFIESVLPVYIRDQYTVPNIMRYNEMLYNICISLKCLYLNTFSSFLIPGTNIRDASLYKGPYSVHLNRRGLAVLAKRYIDLINNTRFNPLAY